MNLLPSNQKLEPSQIELSVIIPSFNSVDYISTTIIKTISALRDSKFSFELVLVDDCSSDLTLETCVKLKLEYEELSVLHLKENQGQRNATALGYHIAKGKYVVTFDDDLQYPVEQIWVLLEKIKATKCKVVSGYYSFEEEKKSYKSLKKIILSGLNYIIFPRFKKSKYITSFKIFNKEALIKSKITNIYFFWEIKPDKIAAVKVKKQIGLRRESKYNFARFFKLLAPLFYKTMQKSAIAVSICSIFFALILGKSLGYYIFLIALLLALLFKVLLNTDKKSFLKAPYQIY